MKRLPGVLLFVLISLARVPGVRAQKNESVGSDLAQERKNLGSCKHLDFHGVSTCAENLFTGKPIHIAIDSLAPQNGVGFGLDFADDWHPTFCTSWVDFTEAPRAGSRNLCHWSGSWSVDGEATPNASWRSGAYLRMARISSRTPKPHIPKPGQPVRKPRSFTRPSPLFDLYVQGISLNRIYFYGIGPASSPAARAAFGFSEPILGLHATVPLPVSALDFLGVSLLGEVNGRFPSLRGDHGESSPSIEALYNVATAPGLSTQPIFAQFAEGIRFVPALPYNRLRLNYLVNFQQFHPPSSSAFAFRRLTFDFNNVVPLYTVHRGSTAPPAASPQPENKDTHQAATPGPLSPGSIPSVFGLPAVSSTHDFTGSIAARLLIVESTAKAGSTVPFYFQPTLGGSDINGQSMLASYPDYRFRAPNLLLLSGDFQQSLGKLPAAIFFSYQEGKVGYSRNDIAFDHLRHTFSAGVTLQAGNLPVVYLLFSWGGHEGHSTTATLSNTLFDAGGRPSLF